MTTPAPKSLQQFLSELVESPEPSSEGSWYCVERDDLPFSVVEFHFDDFGKLTAARLSDYDGNEIYATSEIKWE